jgi:hypothetical protein
MTSKTSEGLTRKELLWLSCRQKTCCIATKVVIQGRDMWRITSAMEVMPWTYTRYTEAAPDTVDGFRLAPGGPLYQVVLAKRGEVGPEGAPCFFLMTLNDGHAQCGLGPLKPVTCQVYPAVLADNLLRAESGTCTCRRWSLLDLDVERDTSLLNDMLDQAAEYKEIVEGWNNQLDITDEPRTYRDFCRYVIDAYSALEGTNP